MKIGSAIVVFGLPWLVVFGYAGASLVSDYQRFNKEKSAEKQRILSTSTDLKEQMELIVRELKIVKEQFRSLKEKDTYEASALEATETARTLERECERVKLRFFPRTQSRLKIAAGQLVELAEHLMTAFELKKKLLETEEEIARSRFRTRPNLQIRLYVPYDIFGYLQQQEELARREAELLALEQEVAQLKARLDSNLVQADAVIATLSTMALEIESDLEKESALEYDDFLREKLAKFSLRKKLLALTQHKQN